MSQVSHERTTTFNNFECVGLVDTVCFGVKSVKVLPVTFALPLNVCVNAWAQHLFASRPIIQLFFVRKHCTFVDFCIGCG